MSLLDTPISSITIYADGGNIVCAQATEVNVRQPVTEEIYSAFLRLDYDYVGDLETAGKTIEIGNSIDVYLGRGTVPPTKVFSGKIWNYNKEIEGHIPRWYEIEARGWGDYLIGRYTGYTRTIDTIDNVIKWIVNPLVAGGTLSAASVQASSTTVTFDHLEDQLTMFDALREVCGYENWDFYVDNERILHAFPIGTIETSETFENKILTVNWTKSGDHIINAQRVVGAAGSTVGSDADYSESASGWGGTDDPDSWYWTRGLGFGGATIDPDPNYGGGTRVVRSVVDDASGGMYMARTFSPAIDLSMHGILNFAMKYAFDSLAVTHGLDASCQIQVDIKTDNSNYFSYVMELPGKMNDDWGIEVASLGPPFPYYRWTWGWQPVEVSFNMMASRYPVTIIGTPRWDSIGEVKWSIIRPLPLSGPRSKAVLKIDNVYFDRGYYYSFRQDSTSIGKYGERRGKLLYVKEYTSNSECEGLADQIILNYKDPVPRFKGLKTNDLATVYPGEQATITVKEISDVSIIRAIEYNLNEYDLNMSLDLSSVYMSDYDRLVSDMKKDIEALTQDLLPTDLNPTALFKFLSGPLGPKDIDMSHSQPELIWNAQFEIDSDMDGIPDKWYPNADTISFRTDDESHLGQYAAQVKGGYTLESEYFPVNQYASYWYGVLARAEHDSNYGTLSAYIVYHGIRPSLTPKGTFTIAESISPTSWSRYYAMDTTLPAQASWAKMRLVGDEGDSNYFDDVFAKRLRGTSSGETPDKIYSIFNTASESLVTVESRTFSPGSMMYRYSVIEGSMELKVDTGAGAYIGQIILNYNGVAKETINTSGWSGTQTTYTYYSAATSIDYMGYGETLTVDYKINTSDGDTTYMRNPEIKIITQALEGVMLTPWGATEE